MTKCDKDGGRVKNSWNSCDVIYRWPLNNTNNNNNNNNIPHNNNNNNNNNNNKAVMGGSDF